MPRTVINKVRAKPVIAAACAGLLECEAPARARDEFAEDFDATLFAVRTVRPTCALCLRCTRCAADAHATCDLCAHCSRCHPEL